MKNLLIVLIFFVFKSLLAHADEKTKYSKNSLDKEVYYKIGIFDYKHPTDMLAVNRKVVHNKQTDLRYIGAVNKIYDLMIMGDKIFTVIKTTVMIETSMQYTFQLVIKQLLIYLTILMFLQALA